MAIKILGNTIIDDDQNINSAGTAKFKVASANGVEVQTIGGNEGTKFPFVGKNTSGTTTFSVDGDGNVTANAFIGDGSNLTGISRITNNNQLTNGAGYITSADGGNAATLDGQQGSYYSNYNNLSNKPSLATLGYTGATNADRTGSTPTFTDVYNNGWFRNNQANEGLYNQATGAYFYAQAGNGVWNLTGNSQNTSTSLIFRGSHLGNVEGWLHADGANYFGFLNDAGQWALKQFKVDGYSPNLWFAESGNESWTGNPSNDEGKIEYHSNRFYIASGANSTEVVRFRRSSTDVGYVTNDGNMYLTSSNHKVYHAGNDGSGSGLDADLLDGQHGSHYLNYNNLSNKPSIPTHTSHLTNNSGFLTSIPSTVVQYNAWGNVNISGIIQGKSFRCRAGENGAVKNTFNIEWSPGRNGRLWIGTTDVGQIYLSSDYRLKRNITPMSNGALDRIKMVNPVSYQWDDFERDGVELSSASEEINEGFIAHELQQIIPSAVDGEKDDPITIQSLKPDAIMAVAVKAIQELSAKNDALEARIAQLESN